MLGLDPPPEVWGLHGAERLYPDGRRALEKQAPAVRRALEELRRKLHRDALGGIIRRQAKCRSDALAWARTAE